MVLIPLPFFNGAVSFGENSEGEAQRTPPLIRIFPVDTLESQRFIDGILSTPQGATDSSHQNYKAP